MAWLYVIIITVLRLEAVVLVSLSALGFASHIIGLTCSVCIGKLTSPATTASYPMEKLTPNTDFSLWKLRVVPALTAKAAKSGIKEPAELLPTVLDDTVCTAYAQWLDSTPDPPMNKALDFLQNWLLTNKGSTAEYFLARSWTYGETVEEYVNALANLAAPLHINTSDRAFKSKFVDGLPLSVQPFLRLELRGASWPSLGSLIERVKLLAVRPSLPAHATEITQSQEVAPSVLAARAPHQHQVMPPRHYQQPRPSSTSHLQHHRGVEAVDRRKCYNCSGFGHLARQCPSPRPMKNNQGNDQRL
jgi:hypothetical protein